MHLRPKGLLYNACLPDPRGSRECSSGSTKPPCEGLRSPRTAIALPMWNPSMPSLERRESAASGGTWGLV